MGLLAGRVKSDFLSGLCEREEGFDRVLEKIDEYGAVVVLEE